MGTLKLEIEYSLQASDLHGRGGGIIRINSQFVWPYANFSALPPCNNYIQIIQVTAQFIYYSTTHFFVLLYASIYTIDVKKSHNTDTLSIHDVYYTSFNFCTPTHFSLNNVYLYYNYIPLEYFLTYLKTWFINMFYMYDEISVVVL